VTKSGEWPGQDWIGRRGGVGFVLKEVRSRLNRRAMDGGKIGVIRLVCGVRGLGEMLVGRRMDHPTSKPARLGTPAWNREGETAGWRFHGGTQ